MVKKNTNLVKHKEIERQLLKKAQTGIPLNKEEEARAKQQIKVIQNNKALLGKGVVNAADHFYKKLKNKKGEGLIDL